MRKKMILSLCLLLGLTAVCAACKGGETGGQTTTAASTAGTSAPQTTTQASTTLTTAAQSTTAVTTAAQSTAAPVNGTPGKTLTGRDPLPLLEIPVNDPQNTRGLPTKGIGHSFGLSKNGKPHEISIASQKFFDDKNYKAVTLDTKTPEKVLYLTFDCGWENGNTAKILDTLKTKQVPAAFFVTKHHAQSEPALIARMINEGHIVGNHSVKHPNFSKIDRTRMAEEILGCDNYLRETFGYTSPYFRFPEGEYSESALDLVQSMGFTSVFWSCAYADWDVDQQKGKTYAFDTVTSRLHPGAVILLHAVSADNNAAMGDIIDWARGEGYEFRSLDALPQ